MKAAIVLVVSFALLGNLPATGQHLSDEEVRMEVSFVSGIAVGDFEDHLDQAAIGAAFLIGGRVPRLPLVLGTEVALLNYGNHDQLFLTSLAGVPISTAEVSSKGMMALGHLVVRLQPAAAAFTPYVEGLVGFKYFFGRASVATELPLPRRSRASSVANFDDLALSGGGGGGLLLTVYSGNLGWDQRSGTVSLDLGIRYLVGEKATLLAPDAIMEDGDRVTFSTIRTRTDMLMPRVGVRVAM